MKKDSLFFLTLFFLILGSSLILGGGAWAYAATNGRTTSSIPPEAWCVLATGVTQVVAVVLLSLIHDKLR